MLAEISITPLDKGESVSAYVAEIINLIHESGLEYRLGSMGTVVEGEPEEVFDLIKKCHFKMREMSRRVITHIYIDDREGASNRISGKIDAVEHRLGKKLRR